MRDTLLLSVDKQQLFQSHILDTSASFYNNQRAPAAPLILSECWNSARNPSTDMQQDPAIIFRQG